MLLFKGLFFVKVNFLALARNADKAQQMQEEGFAMDL